MNEKSVKTGKVYLVGAGPGDPSLITLRGIQVLSLADEIYYDHLANSALLNHAKPGAKKKYVGKEAGHDSHSQRKIEKKLICSAKRGKIVVRLKGGDPFLFGRGAEEAIAIKKSGLAFEIVPGITSASAVPTYAGIPLTHRDYASTVAFVTGHEAPANGAQSIDWKALAGMQTIVFLMGFARVRENFQALMSHGLPQSTPACAIQWGTHPFQKTIVGTLESLPQRMMQEELKPPIILVVSRIIDLRSQLNWFESKPFFGKNVWVMRSQNQVSDLKTRLQNLGAHVVEFPVLELAPPKTFKAIDHAIDHLKRYPWLLFTSAHGVDVFFTRLKKRKKDLRALSHLKVGAIGQATAKKIREYGCWVDLVPQSFKAEAFAKRLRRGGVRNCRILLPRAREAREVLVEELKKLKCKVEVVEAYQSRLPLHRLKELNLLMKNYPPHWLVFASSQTVKNFMTLFHKANLDLKNLFSTKIACIGPMTAKTAREDGFKVDAMPKRSTIKDLVEEMSHSYS